MPQSPSIWTPNDTAFDGDEIQIASSIAEDPDDAGDQTVVGHGSAPAGSYRVVGTIDDGEASAVSVAPGQVIITAPPSPPGGEGEPEPEINGYWAAQFVSDPTRECASLGGVRQ